MPCYTCLFYSVAFVTNKHVLALNKKYKTEYNLQYQYSAIHYKYNTMQHNTKQNKTTQYFWYKSASCRYPKAKEMTSWKGYMHWFIDRISRLKMHIKIRPLALNMMIIEFQSSTRAPSGTHVQLEAGVIQCQYSLYTPEPFPVWGVLSCHLWWRSGGCSRLGGMQNSEISGRIFSIRSSKELFRVVVIQRHGHLASGPIWACPWTK